MSQVRDVMTSLDTSQRLSFWFSLGITYNEIVSCHNLKASGTSKQTCPKKKDRVIINTRERISLCLYLFPNSSLEMTCKMAIDGYTSDVCLPDTLYLDCEKQLD